jgi:hypothetical protein
MGKTEPRESPPYKLYAETAITGRPPQNSQPSSPIIVYIIAFIVRNPGVLILVIGHCLERIHAWLYPSAGCSVRGIIAAIIN